MQNLNLFLVLAVVLSGGSAHAQTDDQGEAAVVRFGDMIVEKTDLELSVQEPLGAVKLKVKLWEDGVIPVTFDKNATSTHKETFFHACAAWEAVANVRCIEGSYKGRTLRLTRFPIGCFSLYGMGSNFLVLRRWMNLDDPGCWDEPTIMHELGHSLGLIHEHQRPDRDEYVTIHPENAKQGFLGLNAKINLDHIGSNPLTQYDFLSIMHYSRTEFSKNKLDTIVPKSGYEQYLNVMGRVKAISSSDAVSVRALYGPPSAYERY